MVAGRGELTGGSQLIDALFDRSGGGRGPSKLIIADLWTPRDRGLAPSQTICMLPHFGPLRLCPTLPRRSYIIFPAGQQ